MKHALTGIAILAAAVGIFVAGSAAAAAGWRPFATGSDTGQYGAFAQASGDVVKPHALGLRVRATGDTTPDFDWFISCEGHRKGGRSGVVYVLDVATSAKCTVNGTANNEGGSVTVTLLRR